MRWVEAWTPAALSPCSREVTHEPVLTAPNTITVVRAVVSILLAMAAVAQTSAGLLVAAYLVYWVGDLADGEVARRLGLETRIGAVFDIVADRANSLTCAACFVALDPRLAVPLTIYVVEFAVVDTMLSLGFLAFEVKRSQRLPRDRSRSVAVELVAAGEGTQHLVHRAVVRGGSARLGNGLRRHGPRRQGLVVPAVARPDHHHGAGGEAGALHLTPLRSGPSREGGTRG